MDETTHSNLISRKTCQWIAGKGAAWVTLAEATEAIAGCIRLLNARGLSFVLILAMLSMIAAYRSNCFAPRSRVTLECNLECMNPSYTILRIDMNSQCGIWKSRSSVVFVSLSSVHPNARPSRSYGHGLKGRRVELNGCISSARCIRCLWKRLLQNLSEPWTWKAVAFGMFGDFPACAEMKSISSNAWHTEPIAAIFEDYWRIRVQIGSAFWLQTAINCCNPVCFVDFLILLQHADVADFTSLTSLSCDAGAGEDCNCSNSWPQVSAAMHWACTGLIWALFLARGSSTLGT